MSIKEDIKKKEAEIESLERKIRDIDSKIRNTESQIRQVRSSKNMGIAFMGNSTTRPLGAYKYISGSNNETMLNSELTRLKSQKSSLEWDLHSEERELDDLEKKYKNLPEAKLTSSKYGIHFEGDSNQRDVLEPLRKKMEDYAEEHKRIRSSKAVAEYIDVKEKLSEAIKNGHFPDATKRNLDEVKSIRRQLLVDVGYIVVEDKILVEGDFATSLIDRAESKMEVWQRKIDENQQRREVFKPTFWGRVFKRVGEKQRAELETKISNVDMEYKSYLTGEVTDFKYYTEMKEKYVVPAMEIKKLIDKYKLAIIPSDVNKYMANPEKYQKDIDENTILKDIGVVDIPAFIIKHFQTYLDNHDLKLSRETLLQAICESEFHKELAARLVEITGYQPKGKETENEKA